LDKSQGSPQTKRSSLRNSWTLVLDLIICSFGLILRDCTLSNLSWPNQSFNDEHSSINSLGFVHSLFSTDRIILLSSLSSLGWNFRVCTLKNSTTELSPTDLLLLQKSLKSLCLSLSRRLSMK
jgi:hypothetical protein